MKYEILTDNDNNIIQIYQTESETKNTFKDLEEVDYDKLYCSKVIDDEIVLDEEKYRTKKLIKEINDLKTQLSSTDYKIIKCSECQLAGIETPYDIAELHATRQALRDKINELESHL